MKVSELIEKLSKLNQDLEVYVPVLDEDFPEFQQATGADENELGSENDPDDEAVVVTIS